jgi:hypothetical protein
MPYNPTHMDAGHDIQMVIFANVGFGLVVALIVWVAMFFAKRSKPSR